MEEETKRRGREREMGITNVIVGAERLAWLKEEVKRREKGSVSALLRDWIDEKRREQMEREKEKSAS